MALADAFGADAPYDPGQGVDDLARQVFPDDVGPGGPVDPGRLVDAVARRQDRKTRHIDEKALEPAEAKPPSSYGEPVVTGPPPSSFGEPVKAADVPESIGAVGNAKALLKGIPAGAADSAGGALKGAAALYDNGTPAQAETPQYDPMGNVTGMTAPATAAIAPKPLQDRTLYKAGQAVQDLGPTMTDAEKNSLGGTVGHMAGAIAPYAAATLVGGPAIGLAAGFTGMAADTYGSVYEDAIKQGATEDVAKAAAGKSALVAGVLGSLPLGAGKYAKSLIAKIASSSAAFATAGEAQEAILQQIKKDYDPKAGYTFDQKRLIAELILGAGMGGLHHAFERKPDEVNINTSNDTTNGGLPPPRPGIGPDNGAGPDTTGAGPSPGPDTGPQPGPDSGSKPSGPPPGTGEGVGADYTMDPKKRAKMEETLRTFDPKADIKNMSDADLFNTLNDHLRDTSNTGYTAKPETPEEAAAREQTATERTEREGLKRAGWTEAHIAVMTPAERRRRFQEAMARGSASERPPEPEASGSKNTTEQPASATTSSPDKVVSATGTRADPINIKTADDVLKASEVVAKDPTDPQAEATNFKHGHAEIEHLGLTGKNSISLETGVGDTRKGVGPDGKPWSVNMPVAYGRIKGTRGADGEPLDVFIGSHPDSQHVFIIDQHHGGGKGFDEHKILTGFHNPIEALHAYANSYTDGGGDRIGAMVALTPDQFKDWIKNGDHSKPIGTIGQTEVIPPARVAAEPTKEHHAQIEAALGEDYHHVLPVDTARAAEILSENEGMPPHVAFGQAVIENAVAQKFLTHQQAEQAYGEKVNALLQPGREGTSGSGAPSEQERPASGEVGAGSAAENEVVPSGGEAGASGGTGKPEHGSTATGNTGTGGTVKPDTRGDKAAGDETGNAVEEQPAAVNADEPVKPKKTKAPVVDEPVPEPVKERLEDAGEKIGGARKDQWVGTGGLTADDLKGMTSGELVTNVTKHNIWPRPDYAAAVDGGVEPVAAALMKRVYDRISVKPGEAPHGDDENRTRGRFIDALTAVRNEFAKIKTLADIKKLSSNVSDALGPSSYGVMGTLRQRGGKSNPLWISGADIRTAEDAVAKGFPNMEPWQRLFEVRYGSRWPTSPEKKAFSDYFEASKAPFQKENVSLDLASGGTNHAGFISLREWRGTKSVEPDTMSKGLQETYLRLLELRDRASMGPAFYVSRKNGGTIGTYDTRDLAEAAAKEAYAKIGKPGGGEEEPNRPHLDAINRDGPDYRKDRDVTGEDFIKDFGFRGVEFGNWVAGDERQKVVNLAYDAIHDLARVLNLPAKAMSLDGTLAVGFGSRGKGGKGAGAAHYEADRTVINMTKIAGAGSLAHEWMHALDHYLGEFGTANPYAGGTKSISGWRTTPQNVEKAWRGRYAGSMSDASAFNETNMQLKPRLRVAVNKLMHDLFNKEETDAENEARLAKRLEDGKRSQQSWIDHAKSIKDRMRTGGSSAGLKKAEDQVGIWDRSLKEIERQIAVGNQTKKTTPTNYLKEATKLSGKSGDYWRRPNEMLARAGEAFVFDKIQAEGFTSQYLVQGVEPTRYAAGFKGNPYPQGEERKQINEDFERIIKALTTGEGKHGINTRIQGAEGEPEPIITRTPVKTPTPQPKPVHEMIAVDEASKTSLSDAFAKHFASGDGFDGILAARKFAKDAGFSEDPKSVEEAIEFGVVQAARLDVLGSASPQEKFKTLVALYGRQPRLGTRTSTSVREQAYSTPVPLAYIASELAGINDHTKVFEPTAGNGALLIAASPRLTFANELNPDRQANLKASGFLVGDADASELRITNAAYDVVIANPPFGAVKTEGVSKVFDMGDIQPNYQTHEIDHAIALRALAGMKDNGKAVLILGGVNKLASTREARSDAYNGKAKREFFKTLYDKYGVTDHFTVSGDLYERQGAGWPVDVIVINGRGKSSRALPAVDVPRIYKDWTELGGLIDGQQNASNDGAAGGQHVSDVVGQPGLAGSGIVSSGDAGQVGDRGAARGEKPAGVVQQPVRDTGNVSAGGGGNQNGSGAGGIHPADRPDRVAPTVGSSSGLDLDALISGAIDDAYAPEGAKTSGPRAPRGPRTARENVKSAADNATSAADKAFSGLYELFGGGKTHGAGPAFDEETYAKAKPLFTEAAGNFRDLWGDLRELVKRMVEHLRDAMRFTKEAMERIAPYLKRFLQELEAGEHKLGEKEKKPDVEPRAERAKEGASAETESQVRYTPKSEINNLDTLVPVNMKRSIEASLNELERRVGPIDKFVAKELGYSIGNREIEDYFGAEQIDALGLAIDNINRGKGFIIGDQTGIGKGRVNAAIIKWAIKNGRVPVFVTEKPGLYADIYRDMKDIGMADEPPRILATNASLSMPLEDGKGGAALKNGDAKLHDRLLASVSGKEEFHKHFDMVFTNYSQMQTVKGEDTGRRNFLKAIAPHAVVIMDESHNAGGTEAKKPADAPKGRSDFARDLVQNANGVFYSSATYAKRPDVMDLYSATDMSMAVGDIKDLGEAISRGGVPMQQAVANMLAEAGQYIRRERSFAGIEYNTPLVPVNRDNYNKISGGLSAIQDFSAIVQAAVRDLNTDLMGEGEGVGFDGATGDAGVQSTNFTSIMHNIINQMLLAMKVEPAAQMAIDAIKRGEKPVLTVANTMESFLKDYADAIGIKQGDEMPADFSDVLQKYLDRTRTITIKKPFMKKGEKAERRRLTDEELGPAGVAAYHKTMELIGSMNLSDLPVSPIDHLKGRLQKEGYSVGEITGRGTIVDYTGKGDPVLRTRPGGELTTKGRNETLKKFNTKPANGGHHALVINQAGSTGLSAHASKNFNDQSVRHMFIVQPEGNIDTHMQLLGRVNRTGQVVLPRYSQLVADIPAEKRPAAVLAKKMASLNANTTASRTSAVTAKDTPDFINEYGDLIAANYLSENFEMNPKLAMPIKFTESGRAIIPDAMRKLTGRIPLLPLQDQEALYQELEGAYEDMMKQLSAAGTNPMEAKTYDLKAKSLETTEVQGRKNDSGSPFAAPVNVEKVSVARLGKPYTPAEVMQKVLDELAEPGQSLTSNGAEMKDLARLLDEANESYKGLGRAASNKEDDERKRAVKEFAEYIKPIIEGMPDAEKQAKELAKFNAIKDRWVDVHRLVKIGQRVTLKTADGNLTGIITGVYQKGVTKNPLALSSWKAEFAIADASRHMILPFSRIYADGKADENSALDVEVVPLQRWIEGSEATLNRFAHMQSDAREERYIASGNLLAAYDWLNRKGAIINYTDDKGGVRQGIITARDFDLSKHAIDKGLVVSDPAEIKAWLDNNPTETIYAKGEVVSVRKQGSWSSEYVIATDKTKKVGGIYFLDKKLVDLASGDFISRSGRMVTDVMGGNLIPAIARMQELGAVFTVKTTAPKATKVEEPLAQISEAATEARPEIEGLLREILQHLVGDHAKVEFSADLMPLAGTTGGWGSLADTSPGARGLYYPSRHLIKLALLHGVDSTAFHEAYHAIEYQLQSPQERALMDRETPRIRDYIQKTRGYTKEQVDGLDPEEVRAIGFEDYATDRSKGEGLHIGVRRWWHRLWEAIKRLANGLRGLGFKTYEDIYDKAYRGEYAKAEGDTPRPEAAVNDDAPLASIFEKRTKANGRVSEKIANLFNDSVKADLKEVFSDLSHREGLLQKEVEARYLGLTPEEAKKVFPEASKMPDAMQFYVKKELIPGKVAHQANDFRSRLLKPLIETANRAKITLPDLGDYLMAKGALERNRNIAPLYEPGHPFNDAMRDNNVKGGSGFSNNEARDQIRTFESGPKGAAFKDIWRQTRNVVDFNRQMMVHYGLESQATIDAWKQRGPDYVPYKGFEEAEIDDELYFGGKGSALGIRAPETKRAFGRMSKADNPMVHLIDQAYRTIERGERNMHYNSIAETLATLKQNGINIDDFVSLNKGKPRQEIDNRTGLARWVDTSPSAMAKGAVNFKRRGVPNTMLFKSEKLAQSINRNSPWTFPGLRHVLLGVNKLKSMWTHYSPDFAARHFFGRYMVEGALNAYQLKDTGAYSPAKWTADAFPGLGRASRAIFAHEKGRPSGQLGAYWAEMKAQGGNMAFRSMRDIDSIKNELVEDLKQITTRSRLNPLRVLKGIADKTDEIFNVWDNATRLATYAQARDQGMTPQAAAYRARNATVNYQKRALISNVMGVVMPFYNTAVRTGTRLTSAMQQSSTMRKVALGVLAAGVALALNNYLLGGSDENGDPYFEKVPEFERALGFIFLNPFERDAQGRPMKYALPNAYNYALPMTIGYHLTGMLLDKVGAIKSKITLKEHALEMVKSTLMAFTPLGEFGNLMDLITPELLRPIAHIIENKNWLGNPVHNDMFQKGPNSESGRKPHGDYIPTGEGWKDTAKFLNSATGGDAHHSGLLDMYPEDIRELADQMFGAQKRFGIEVGNTTGSIMKGETPKATDVPIARVFRGIDYDQADAVARAKHRYEQKHPWQQ